MLIDNQTFNLLKTAINKDGWLELPAFGNSMFPFINQGNVCKFVPFESSLMKKGDIILFYSKTGKLIAHRLLNIKRIDNQQIYYLKGDTNLGLDKPITEKQILGKLESVQKKYIIISHDNFLSHFWGILITTFPIISGILRKYINRKV